MNQQWIDVREALPPLEEGCKYSVTVLVPNPRFGRVVLGYYFIDSLQSVRWTEAGEYAELYSFEATHWMPLPAPPVAASEQAA